METIYEKDLLPKDHAEYLKTMNIDPKVIYDIGACVLHWTRKAKEVWPNSEYVLFDASAAVEPYLKSSGDHYVLSVLSDVDNKEVEFYENTDHPGGNSYYKENTHMYTEKHKKILKTRTLNTLVEKHGLPKPELIKLDIQGAELDVLHGADKILDSCTDIILEAQLEDYNLGAPKIEEVKTYLESIGFELISKFSEHGVDADYHFKRI